MSTAARVVLRRSALAATRPLVRPSRTLVTEAALAFASPKVLASTLVAMNVCMVIPHHTHYPLSVVANDYLNDRVLLGALKRLLSLCFVLIAADLTIMP